MKGATDWATLNQLSQNTRRQPAIEYSSNKTKTIAKPKGYFLRDYREALEIMKHPNIIGT